MDEPTRATCRTSQGCPAWCTGEHEPGDPHHSVLESFGVRVDGGPAAVQLSCAWLAPEPAPYVEVYLHDGTSVELNSAQAAFWGRVLEHIAPNTLGDFAEALTGFSERLTSAGALGWRAERCC